MTQKTKEPSASASLFQRIVNDLRGKIVEGDLPEHTALPSERVVAELHGVSRMTARRALEAIEASGLAYSQDRKGRFVSPKRLNYNVGRMVDFIEDAALEGIEIEEKLLDSKQSVANDMMAKTLSIPVGTPLFENTRLFLREGHATFFETEIVIAQRCADLLKDTAPEYLQEQRYSPLGHTADIVIRMCALDPEEAELLGLVPYQAGIEQEQLVRDISGKAFCFSRQIWRGEMAQFSAKTVLDI